ncbi:MAG: methylenetetrahydrofolate reductase C-terminal domain-containing protein [Chloroflexi bacterium]|nr:methylenetetrahydrofolate reductase C-terminal domain-containing protein [Chloroflexota bacterium]MCL5273976.1 methylenetetrahydrofolate reductase C-terminal domain-containing protein [Chloroflexota bacterium]
MPIFTPGRRWQPPYYPFKKVSLGKRLLATVERSIKGPLFGCRMCGNCLLQETAFICPMECAKGARNGPCGGSTETCYVDRTRPCIWYAIYDRAEKMGRSEKLLEVLPPLDWDKVGTETWGDVWNQVKHVGVKNVCTGLLSRDAANRARVWDSVFQPVRQPVWWSGDSQYHAPKYTEPASELERRLRGGEFVVTAEVAPSLSPNTTKFLGNVESLRDYVTAMNFTDNASAMPRVASWASGVMAIQKHVEPVMQITARDHNRLNIQSDVLGANALGIRNVLCISGDSSREGAVPMARLDILDVDSIQILWMLRRLRDEGKYLDGREIKQLPKYFLGAAASPMASEPRFQAIREHKKINAGAQFMQTNVVYDTDILETWLNELAKRNILDKVYLLIGVMPLKSLKMANRMTQVPGIVLPASILKRMEAAGDGAEEEGIKIALEIIERIRAKQAVSGVHLMTVGWESIIPRIVTEAGLKRVPAELKALA